MSFSSQICVHIPSNGANGQGYCSAADGGSELVMISRMEKREESRVLKRTAAQLVAGRS